MKIAIKREQRQAVLGYAEREQFRAKLKTKKLLFAAAALTVLTACNTDESPIENTENRVPVKLAYTNIDAVETRAAQDLNQGTFATGESVKVRVSNTGAGEWSDYTFTTGSAGAMTPGNPAPYYPAGSQNIDIVAYYPATAGTTFTVADDQTADASYKASDLMFASVTNQAKQAEAVNLAFTHKMAKLNVNVTAGQGVSSITSVSLLNVKPTVSFDQATGAVGAASGEATTIAISNQGAAVIPAQTIDGGLLSIVTDQGTATYSVSNKAFAAGNLYTMNITVNLRAVGTTTDITGWISEGTLNITPGDWTVEVSGTYTYTGSAIVPDAGNITVRSTKTSSVIDPANYDVFAGNNINAGVATLIVSGKGVYAGEVAYCTFTIDKAAGSISYATTSVDKMVGNASFTNPLTIVGDGTVSYESSNTSVATVNSSTGEVNVLAAGETTITATAEGTNYAYANTASYTLTVVAATLANLKTRINNSINCSDFLGFEVYDNGGIAAKGTGSGTVIGYVVHISTTAVDESFSSSRILVIASEDAATSIQWADNKVTTGLNSFTALNGYSNTQTLVNDKTVDNKAAKAAWNYQSKAGTAVVTGSSAWFLPSAAQMIALYTSVGYDSNRNLCTRDLLQAATGMNKGYEYWTSTEWYQDGWASAYEYAAILSKSTMYHVQCSGYEKTENIAVRACFAY